MSHYPFDFSQEIPEYTAAISAAISAPVSAPVSARWNRRLRASHRRRIAIASAHRIAAASRRCTKLRRLANFIRITFASGAANSLHAD
jgi:hypothetical protein